MSTRLNPLDTSWLFTESRATPNHVGGLLTFALPEDAPYDYMRQMMLTFRNHSEFQAPWNRKLRHAFNKNPIPEWVEDTNIDLEYHVRHSALPWPGGERELGELVGRLQGTPLDLSRPPWECTLIEGLEGGRFAMFVKIHHALIDGVSGVKLLERAMATEAAKSLTVPPFWASFPEKTDPNKPPKPKRRNPTMADAMTMGMASLGDQVRNVPQLVTAFTKMIQRVGQGGEGMAVPFDAPHSILNGRVREKRRLPRSSSPLTRLKEVADAANCTINDVVLAICGGALRRFLDERGQLPGKSLTAGIPVSVRPKDDMGTGNAISFIVSTLGTDLLSAKDRLDAINHPSSMQKRMCRACLAPRCSNTPCCSWRRLW
ncbi:MAG: wax ester/triacylglycerol synthase family O-acyltransferase [Brachymonas sp.]|nr:wax ester/triacylglycerol synthase family O-acyltransferase [Brachymonas sp.]